MGVGGEVWLRPVGISLLFSKQLALGGRVRLCSGIFVAFKEEKRGFADSRPLWFAYWEPRSAPEIRHAVLQTVAVLTSDAGQREKVVSDCLYPYVPV